MKHFITCCNDRNHKSITASGVLNKDNSVRRNTTSGNLRHSLTKYQIDSSEYVQPKADESLTDYEKARHNEYKLNIFTVSSYISAETSSGQRFDEQLREERDEDKSISIKTAQTKNDWIQEWAKNARKCNNMLSNSETESPNLQHYSKTSYRLPKSLLLQNKDDSRMTKSYGACFDHNEQFGDDIIGNNSDQCIAKKTDQIKNLSDLQDSISYADRRPPISPTKIPSPMHTHLRTRSSSVNRSRHSVVSEREKTIFYFFIASTQVLCEQCASELSNKVRNMSFDSSALGGNF